MPVSNAVAMKRMNPIFFMLLYPPYCCLLFSKMRLSFSFPPKFSPFTSFREPCNLVLQVFFGLLCQARIKTLKKTSGLLRRDDETVRLWLAANKVGFKGKHTNGFNGLFLQRLGPTCRAGQSHLRSCRSPLRQCWWHGLLFAQDAGRSAAS